VVLFLRASDLGYAPSLTERRVHDRSVVDEAAKLVIPGENITLSCRVMNLSEGGAGVECDAVPPAATKVRLVMEDGRVFDALTAWFENGLLGLSFSSGSAGR
jgi:hypothetical protein